MATIGVILFIIVVAVIAYRHDKKLKAARVTPPVRVPTDEQRDKFDEKHPNL